MNCQLPKPHDIAHAGQALFMPAIIRPGHCSCLTQIVDLLLPSSIFLSESVFFPLKFPIICHCLILFRYGFHLGLFDYMTNH